MTAAIDLFAGPGGWDISARQLGIVVVGIEWDSDAVATRRAAREREGRMNTPAPLSRRPAGFTPPRGPGRCPTCGWHTPTQGHHPECAKTRRDTPR